MGFSMQVRMWADSGPDATVEFTSPPDRREEAYAADKWDGCWWEFTDRAPGLYRMLPLDQPRPETIERLVEAPPAPGWHVERRGTEAVVSLKLPLGSPRDVVTAAMWQVPDEYRHTAQLLFNSEMRNQRIEYRRPFAVDALPVPAPVATGGFGIKEHVVFYQGAAIAMNDTQPAGAVPRKSFGQVAYEAWGAPVPYQRRCLDAPVQQAATADGPVSMETIWLTARKLLCEERVGGQPGVLYTWLTQSELERAKASFPAEHPVRAVLDALVPRPDKGQLTENSKQ